ncbi:hypothetical protein LTR67_007961 [Exophiala xenobiotica]
MPANQTMSSPRIILITGANSGVGLATTEVLTTTPATNFHVIMTGRSLSKLDQARTDLIARHPNTTDISSRLTTCHLDVLDDASIQSALTTISSRFGHLDALINNAAIGNSSDNVRDRFTACLETNVTGAAVVAERFRPLLLLRKPEAENENKNKPYSIYVSSGAGSFARTGGYQTSRPSTGGLPPPPPPPSPRNPDAYHASKAALNMIALLEHRAHGHEINVFVMTPGFVVSNLRGTDENLRTWGGMAGDPMVAGRTLLSIVQGERDADAGAGLVHKDGVFGWAY